MSDTFTLEIYSPRGLELSSEASSVVLPSKQGQIGILPRHCDYVGLLGAGIVIIEGPNGSEKLVVSAGFCKFSENKLVILADSIDTNAANSDKAKREEEIRTLESKFLDLSSYDPEWERAANEISRLRALDALQ